MDIKLYEVGGHVRDSLLGIASKDIDIAVEAPSWEAMREYVVTHTKKIFLEKPEYLTIRAMDLDGLPKDYVLCRKDGLYSDGRRPDTVEPGTILDDLLRRDFSVNSLCRDLQTGELIDPFGGIKDLRLMRLRCVGSPEERFSEDALRIIRAMRFKITRGFEWDKSISSILCSSVEGYQWAKCLRNISTDRIRDELYKCFQHDTVRTLCLLREMHPDFTEVIFEDGLWLEPTMLERK